MASGYKNWAYGYCSETEYPGITQGVVGERKRLYRVSGYQNRRLVRGLREAFERLVRSFVRGLWEAYERFLIAKAFEKISRKVCKRLLFQHWQVQDLTIPVIRHEIIPTWLLRGTRGKIAGTWGLTKISAWVPQFRSFSGIHDYLSLGSMNHSEILFNMICNNKATSQRILAFSSILAHRYDWIKYLRFCMRKLYHAFLNVSHKSQFGIKQFFEIPKICLFWL